MRASRGRGEEQRWVRPGGTYHRFSRTLSAGEGQPFEVELVTLAPGATNWPYHAHARMWEFYYVVSGTGTIRCPEGKVEVGPGDGFMHPPGEPHNLTNTGSVDLTYCIVADDVPNETTIHDG